MDTDKALWLVWGRQVRPGSLALSIVTGAFGVAAALDDTRLSGTWEHVAAVVALLTAGALWVGFWGQSLRAMLAGLLGAVWTWAVVAVVTLAQPQFNAISVIISGCWALLAALLYLRDRREQP